VAEHAGLSHETSTDILSVHDRINKTDLLSKAKKKTPVLCSACHQESVLGDLMSLSAAIHGFHANYLTNKDADACHACHSSSPEGSTRFLRGIHKEMEMDCTHCHGKMEDFSLSLLNAEKASGKKGAARLMKHLKPRVVSKADEILPRHPWINQPDCLNCHVDFQPPDTDESPFNMWTKEEGALFRMRTDDVGIMCQACHGSTHAVYPANNIYGLNRDNIPPLQYQQNPYPIGSNKNCKVCHTIDMEEEVHHPNMLGMFRNER
jgi:hypothetical protein